MLWNVHRLSKIQDVFNKSNLFQANTIIAIKEKNPLHSAAIGSYMILAPEELYNPLVNKTLMV